MTPEQYIERLKALMASGRDRDALEFAAELQNQVQPPLSLQQLDLIGGALESAATMVSLEEAERMRAEARTA